jgi:hypothetical protein
VLAQLEAALPARERCAGQPLPLERPALRMAIGWPRGMAAPLACTLKIRRPVVSEALERKGRVSAAPQAGAFSWPAGKGRRRGETRDGEPTTGQETRRWWRVGAWAEGVEKTLPCRLPHCILLQYEGCHTPLARPQPGLPGRSRER